MSTDELKNLQKRCKTPGEDDCFIYTSWKNRRVFTYEEKEQTFRKSKEVRDIPNLEQVK